MLADEASRLTLPPVGSLSAATVLISGSALEFLGKETLP